MFGEIPEDFALDEERVERHEDGRVTFTLYYPPDVSFKGPDGERSEKIEKLTFRRINTDDLAAAEKTKGDMATNAEMFKRLTGIDAKTFGKLDAYVMLCGAFIIAGFMQPSPPTGDRS